MPAVFGEGLHLDWRCTPLDTLARWPADRPVFLMHSGRLDPRWSRYSVLAATAAALRFTGERTEHMGQGLAAPPAGWRNHPLYDLRTALDHDAGRSLWLGYLGYDTGRWIEHLHDAPVDDRGWPIMQFERCPGWLVYDGLLQTWTAHGRYAHDGPPELAPAPSPGADTFHAGPPKPHQTRDAYEHSVQRVLNYIAAGDVFQVNLTQRLTSAFAGNPRALFAALAQVSPAWYGCYGELTRFHGYEPNRAIASTSPELFLEVGPKGSVTTRPIKGTRPSSNNPDDLRDSEKDAAELNMIIDLMRNDLGRVCTYGSVKVAQPRTIESHPTVHHGVATITGQLHPRMDNIDLLRATLPGGSITGAPKVRAMQIIDELEPVRRGPYCGTIGMIQGQTMSMNIAIRTLLIEQPLNGDAGRVDFSVGGGIVADSTPAGEYDETLAKACAMIAALGA
ncbi:MAG: anthranilate synthase component I family protein [Phycisphaerales bacterium JB063]